MAKEVHPYIGVTGITQAWQAQDLLRCFPLEALPNYRLMVGVLVSLKTLNRQSDRFPFRYPKVEKIRKIFPNHFRALNLVHYHTDDRNTLFSQMMQVEAVAGPNFHGFQLNVCWPPVSELLLWQSESGEEKRLVLQIGGGALRVCENKPGVIAERVGHYSGIIDYVLVDPSGGGGKGFDPFFISDVLAAIEEEGVSARPVVAGGLGPDNLDHLKPVVANYHGRGLSMDAEGLLRTPFEDELDIQSAHDYIMRGSRELL